MKYHTKIQAIVAEAKIAAAVAHAKGLDTKEIYEEAKTALERGIERIDLLMEHEHIRDEGGFCRICHCD